MTVEGIPEWERELIDQQYSEHVVRKGRYDAAVKEFRSRLAGLSDELTRDLLELHSDRNGNWHCYGCDGQAAEPEWPCRTVAALARASEIEVPSL